MAQHILAVVSRERHISPTGLRQDDYDFAVIRDEDGTYWVSDHEGAQVIPGEFATLKEAMGALAQRL